MKMCENARTESLASSSQTPAQPMTQLLTQHLQAFNLPPSATAWLVMLWVAIQLFDDVADADPITRDDHDTVIWATLVAMQSNPFFAHNAAVLLPVVGAMILKWQASDKVERAGHASAQSYMWRAGFYGVVLMTVQLVHGARYAADNAHFVLGWYGERLNDYLGEFQNA